MARHKIHHPPSSLPSPLGKGQARHLFYLSTYRTRDGPRRLWQCRVGGKCLPERRGTAFFNLKTAVLEVAHSLDAMLRGDTQTSTPQTRHHRREALRSWRRRAAPAARAVDRDFVTVLMVTDMSPTPRSSMGKWSSSVKAARSSRWRSGWYSGLKQLTLRLSRLRCLRGRTGRRARAIAIW